MIEKIKSEVKEYLSEERFDHTLGVVEEAQKLSLRYGADPEKAELAALLHDLGKANDIDMLLKIESEFDIILKEKLQKHGALYHATVSRKLAFERYNIEDQDLLNAIRYHTTGRAHMSLLEKIIYIADCIEPSRCFSGVEELRVAAYQDLDRAMLISLENTIGHVIANGLILHEDTVRARNFLIVQSQK